MSLGQLRSVVCWPPSCYGWPLLRWHDVDDDDLGLDGEGYCGGVGFEADVVVEEPFINILMFAVYKLPVW